LKDRFPQSGVFVVVGLNGARGFGPGSKQGTLTSVVSERNIGHGK